MLMLVLSWIITEHHKTSLLAMKASSPQLTDRVAPPLASGQKANSKQKPYTGRVQADNQLEREGTNRLQQTSILQFVRAR